MASAGKAGLKLETTLVEEEGELEEEESTRDADSF
jgi:hypothetical protein